MTTTAIVVLVLALTVVWGGLVLSILNLRRAPAEHDDEETGADGTVPNDAPRGSDAS